MDELAKLVTTVDELAQRLTEAGFKLAPEVLELAVTSIFWDGVMGIVFGVLMLGVGIAAGLQVPGLIGKFAAQAVEYRTSASRDEGGRYIVGAVFCGVAGFFVGLVGLVNLFSGNPWLKVFAPDAALVKQFLL